MQPKESKSNWHFTLSMIKSVFRIFAGVSIIFQDFEIGGFLLILAEVLGILEEL